jgi:hypothetical protein
VNEVLNEAQEQRYIVRLMKPCACDERDIELHTIRREGSEETVYSSAVVCPKCKSNWHWRSEPE